MIQTLVLFVALLTLPTAVAGSVVVSQLFGGGGNSGAPYNRDFVELFNSGATPVVVDGWSIQYATASGTSWQATPLSGTLPPGGYLLIGQATGAGNGQMLPDVDIDGSIAMAASAGKVALIRDTVALVGACPTSPLIVDVVGYGSANCFLGSGPVASLGNSTAALRGDAGCSNTYDNATDFQVAAPQPRNAATAQQHCDSVPSPTAAPSTTSTFTPTATWTPTMTSSPSPTATPSATVVATPTFEPTLSPTATPSMTATASPSATSTVTANATSSPTPTQSATPSATSTPPATVTATASATPSPLPTPSSDIPICGNGIVESGEHCDDANHENGDLCPSGPGADCTYTSPGQLAFGNPRVSRVRRHGCWLGWYVAQSSGFDLRHGLPAERQVCADQDAGCDFDPEPEGCEFRVVACLNVATPDLPNCTPRRIADLSIVAPRQRRQDTEDSASESEFAVALAAFTSASSSASGTVLMPPLRADDVNVCSPPFAIRIALDGAARRSQKLAVRARGGEGGYGLYSRLRLTCRR